MITTILTSVFGALLVAALIAAVKARNLYAVVPKAHLSTPFSNGHVTLLTFHNLGVRTEENIEFVVRSSCKCELLGASKSSVSFANNRIAIARLSRFETVNVVLLVEQKVLEHEDVDTFESKECRGKLVHKKEQASSIIQHVIIWPILVGVLCIPFAIGTIIGKETRSSAIDFVQSAFAMFDQPLAFDYTRAETRSSTPKKAKATTDTVRVVSVTRRGSVVRTKVEVNNKTVDMIELSAWTKTFAGEKSPLSISDTHAFDIVIAPNEKHSFVLDALVPDTSARRRFFIEYKASPFGGDALFFTDTVNLK